MGVGSAVETGVGVEVGAGVDVGAGVSMGRGIPVGKGDGGGIAVTAPCSGKMELPSPTKLASPGLADCTASPITAATIRATSKKTPMRMNV
jgi:hypothetical protein